MTTDATNSPRPLVVAQLAATLPVGGMENVVATLAKPGPTRRYTPVVWCLESLGSIGEELLSDGVRVVVFGRRRRRDLAMFWRLANALRMEHVDLLHCHDELSWFYGTVAARLAGRVQTLVTMHGRRPGIGGRHLLEQRWLASGSSIVAVSAYLGRQLEEELRLPSGRVSVIKNGIPIPDDTPGEASRRRVREALGIGLKDFAIASVAELTPVKNLGCAIRSLKIACCIVPSIRLLIVGDGPLRNDLARQASDAGIAERVTFLSVRRDVQAILPAFDAYLCSSLYEGISLSILEAMAAGLPVVATRVGGNPEIIVDGATGVLVAPDDESAMAAALVRVSESARLREVLGSAAAEMVRRDYSLDRMVADYEDLYAQLGRSSAATSGSIVR